MSKSRLKKSTTALPAALREELGISEPSDGVLGRSARAAFFSQADRRRGGVAGRKEARKAQRQEKKSNRKHTQENSRPLRRQKVLQRQEKKLESPIQSPRPSSDLKGKSKATDPPPKPSRQDHGSSASSKVYTQQLGVRSEIVTPLQRLMSKHDEHAESSKRDRGIDDGREVRKKRKRTALNTTEQAEEDEIAWLEAHLGKRKDDDVGPDGLDELMEDLDRFYPGMYDDKTSESDDDDSKDEEESSSEEEDMSEDDSEKVELEEGFRHDDGDSEALSVDDNRSSFEDNEERRVSNVQGEEASIKVAPAVESSATTSKYSGHYIPPALRKKLAEDTSDDSDNVTRLRRSINGLLNRLGESNLDSIVSGLEEIYRDHSRAQTTSALTKLITDAIASSESMTDSFVVLHATVVASIHRIIGVEFAAHFVEHLIERFLGRYAAERDRLVISSDELVKEPRSLASLLAALYSLDVIASPLMYDVIYLLLGQRDLETGKDRGEARAMMTELDIEILLSIVKLCGAQLRRDDPTSLKQIVHLAQESQSSRSAAQSSLRATFMLESLSDLRNNRSRATTASMAAESTAKMQKYLSGLAKKHTVRTQEPLRVGLHDLRSAEKRGKWWLVGAAWAGYESEREESDDKSLNVGRAVDEDEDEEGKPQDEQLQTLARQHGMNTLIRQQIFTTLMTSQDYLDAVQRLMALTHKKNKQRREIVRVLLHCLGHEKAYNPYYVVVGSRLASEDQMSTRITLQYCLWDYLRRLGEQKVGGQSIVNGPDEFDREEDENEDGAHSFAGASSGPVSDTNMHNTARAYGWWFAKGALGVEALRAVDFTALKRTGERFISLIFVYLYLSVGASSPVQILNKEDGTSLRRNAKDSLEKILVLGTRSNRHVAKGLLVFLQTRLRTKECRVLAKQLGLHKSVTDTLVERQHTALETIRVGVQMASTHGQDDD